MVRSSGALFFANGGMFDDSVRQVLANAGPAAHTVILAAEPITGVDTTAVDELVELDDYLASKGVRPLIAEMKGPVKDQCHRYGLIERFVLERFYPAVGAAGRAQCSQRGIEFVQVRREVGNHVCQLLGHRTEINRVRQEHCVPTATRRVLSAPGPVTPPSTQPSPRR